MVNDLPYTERKQIGAKHIIAVSLIAALAKRQGHRASVLSKVRERTASAN